MDRRSTGAEPRQHADDGRIQNKINVYCGLALMNANRIADLGPLTLPALFKPGLEDQNTPKVVLPIPRASQVLAPLISNRQSIEKPFGSQLFFVEQLFGPCAQRATQPGVDRYGKTHLGSLDQALRHILVEDLPQQPLSLAAANLERLRYLPREFNQAMI